MQPNTETKVFETVKELGETTPRELSRKLGYSDGYMTHLCDYLVKKGLLVKEGHCYRDPSAEKKVRRTGFSLGIGIKPENQEVAGGLQQRLPGRGKFEESEDQGTAGWQLRRLPGMEGDKKKRSRPNAAGMGAYVLGEVIKEKRRVFGKPPSYSRLIKLEQEASFRKIY